jgi:hypothetical protein
MTGPQLGDGPIQPEYERMMHDVARAIDLGFNGGVGLAPVDRKVGFVLLVFPYGSNEGRANYISNGADRADIVRLFREQIARFEADA